MVTIPDDDRKHISYIPVTQEKDKHETQNVKLPIIGVRHWQMLLLFVMVILAFGLRVVLSVAIVAMTDPKASSNPDIPTYQWKDKSIILSAFFWGYLWTQAFAGYAAKRFGAKWFLIGSISTQAILGILTPLTAEYFGSIGMCVSRALQGLVQGFIFPSITNQVSHWVPLEERSRLGSFPFGAAPLGSVIAMLVTGIISASWYGWPMVFYIYGGLGLVWCVMFAFLGSNTPSHHTSISKAERKYIENGLGQKNENPSTHKVPWSSILTSGPVWALFIVQCGYNYCFWTLLTQIPSYMKHVMNFDIKNNSILSSLPYFTLWIVGFGFSSISDFIINKKIVRLGTARKIFNSIGLLVPSVSLVGLAYTRPDQPIQAVVLLVISVGAMASCLSGWILNHMDLSPNYAGFLMGLTSGCAHITALIAPLVVQLCVTDETNLSQWRLVFLLTAGIVGSGAIVFIVFGSATVQPWNEDATQKKEKC